MELEHKFSSFDAVVSVTDDLVIEGYASCFGDADQGGDTVQPGAYAASLASGRGVKMLWQHDVTQPIGVWDELREDTHGLWVKGRLLDGVARPQLGFLHAIGRADPGGGDRRAVDRLPDAARGEERGGRTHPDGTGAVGGVACHLPHAAQCAGGGQGRCPGRRLARSGGRLPGRAA